MNKESVEDLALTMERCIDHINAYVTLNLHMSDIPTLRNIATALRESASKEATEEDARRFVVDAALQGKSILEFAAERGLSIVRSSQTGAG